MLKTDPISLFDEIRASERLRDSIIQVSDVIISEYHQGWQNALTPPSDPAPENHWFEWLSIVKPQVVYDNPTVTATSRRSGRFGEQAKAMGAVLTSWCPRANLWGTLDRIFDDSAFSYGVARLAYEPLPGKRGFSEMDPTPHMPRAYRVAPHRWFCDRAADCYDPANGQGRFAGHVWWADKDDLLKDERFDANEVALLAADAGLDKRDNRKDKEAARRDEIVGYEIWVPEIQSSDDPQAHGTLYTVAVAQALDGKTSEPRWIREPRPFIGPARGPYVLFGYHFVPNCPYPLSPFAAVYDQIRELNSHASAAARSAANKKKMVAVDATHADSAADLQNGRDGEVLVVRGLKDGAVQEIELAGVTKDQYDYIDRLFDRRDRVTGLSESARGNVDDDATATAIADSANQRETRLSMLKRLFAKGTVDVLDSAGWYLFNMPDAVLPLPPEMAEEFVPRPAFLPRQDEVESVMLETGADEKTVRDALTHSPEVVYAGGEAETPLTPISADDGSEMFILSANAGGIEYEDLELRIEPYSMERTNEALLQKRAIESAELVIKIAPLMVTAPHVNWEAVLDMVGQPMNMRDLSDRLLRSGVPMMQQQPQVGGAMPGGGGINPVNGQQPPAMQQAQETGGMLGRAVTLN